MSTYNYAAMPQGRGNFDIYLKYDISQNQSANTSTISLEMGLHALTVYASQTWNSYGNTSCQINGSGSTGQGYDLTGASVGDHVALLTTSRTIQHNDDGTCPQVTLYGSCDCSGTGQGHGEITVYVTPPTIPRASSIKTAGTVVPGSAYPVEIAPASNSFSHTLTLKSGNTTIATKSLPAGVTTTSFTTSETSQLYALYPNSNTATLTLSLTNSISLTSTKNVMMQINTVENSPTFTDFTYIDNNASSVAVTGSNQILVSGVSNLSVSIAIGNKAVAKNSATMIKYVLTCGERTAEFAYSASSSVTATLNAVTSGTIKIRAVDSRGNSTEVIKTANFVPYTIPVIKSISAKRDNGIEEETKLQAEIQIYTDAIGSGTDAVTSITYAYKATTGTTWITGTAPITAGTAVNTYILGDTVDGFAVAGSYDIRLYVQDNLGVQVYRDTALPSGVPVMDIYRNGDTVKASVGHRVNESGTMFQIGGENVSAFVVEQGRSGIWNYKKWSDGKLEAFGVYYATVTDSNKSNWDNGWNFAGEFQSTLPYALIDNDFVVSGVVNNVSFITNVTMSSFPSATFQFYIGSPHSLDNGSYTARLYIQGKWQ